MKLSELIEQAQRALAEHGDIEVCTEAPECNVTAWSTSVDYGFENGDEEYFHENCFMIR